MANNLTNINEAIPASQLVKAEHGVYIDSVPRQEWPSHRFWRAARLEPIILNVALGRPVLNVPNTRNSKRLIHFTKRNNDYTDHWLVELASTMLTHDLFQESSKARAALTALGIEMPAHPTSVIYALQPDIDPQRFGLDERPYFTEREIPINALDRYTYTNIHTLLSKLGLTI